MNEYIELLESKREDFLQITKDLSVEQFNFIPAGFNNNVIWNIGHTLSVGQSYLYEKSGFPIPDHPILLEKFDSGTKPEIALEQGEIAYIRNSLLESVRFFKENTTGNGGTKITDQITTKSLQFVLFHDNYHYDAILNLMKSI